jgi:Secretion system C-terminal sorting domain
MKINKNKILVLLMGITISFVVTGFDILNDDGRAGRTGSPGESTCVTNCHNTFALNDGTGSVTISSPDLVNWEYFVGDTYTINVTVTRSANNLFGVGVECLDGSSPIQNAGTLIITNSAETQIKTAVVSTVSRRNVVHQLNGGVGTGTKTFSFKWAAPTTDQGTVTFYVAGNAADGNTLRTNDHIYTINQPVTSAPFNSVRDEESNSAIQISPNPATDNITVKYTGAAGTALSVDLISMEGKLIQSLYAGEADGTQQKLNLSIPPLAAGIYFVRVTDGNTSSVKRLVIQ